MNTSLLFVATVLIWGTTWIAIALQIGAVPVMVSIFYRFALAGLVLLFWHDLFTTLDGNSLRGIAWAGFGTLMFSFGNMASRRNTALGTSPVTANAWGMGMGAAVLLTLILATGQPVVLPDGITYWAALAYLAVIGPVTGFTTYLLLVQKIGSARAGYAMAVFPMVALLISTLFEGYQWTWTAAAGPGCLSREPAGFPGSGR